MNTQSTTTEEFHNIQPDVAHVVLTRFNVRYTKNRNSLSIGNNPTWLTHRFTLFEQYCLPSLIQQSNQDFTWLIFFDIDTPVSFAQRARTLAEKRARTHAIFCDDLPIERLRKEITQHIQSPPAWLLSTRIDNDDGIHTDFLKVVRETAQYDFAHVINAPVGLILKSRRTYVYRHESNAFISLYEPYIKPNTIFSINRHVDAAKSYPVIQTVERPLWLQVIHGKNISNRIRGSRVKLLDVAQGFPPLERLGDVNEKHYNLLLENLTIGIARSLVEKLTPFVKFVGRLLGMDLRKKVRESKVRE